MVGRDPILEQARILLGRIKERRPEKSMMLTGLHGVGKTVLLTQDAKTITTFAFDRIRAGKPMPGVIEIRRKVPIAVAIEELLVLFECSEAGDWEGQVLYVPLR